MRDDGFFCLFLIALTNKIGVCCNTVNVRFALQPKKHNAHSDPQVYAAHIHSPTHPCPTALLCSTGVLLVKCENTTVRNKSCPTERERIELLVAMIPAVRDYCTFTAQEPPLKIYFVQVGCEFCPKFLICYLALLLRHSFTPTQAFCIANLFSSVTWIVLALVCVLMENVYFFAYKFVYVHSEVNFLITWRRRSKIDEVLRLKLASYLSLAMNYMCVVIIFISFCLDHCSNKLLLKHVGLWG